MSSAATKWRTKKNKPVKSAGGLLERHQMYYPESFYLITAAAVHVGGGGGSHIHVTVGRGSGVSGLRSLWMFRGRGK